MRKRIVAYYMVMKNWAEPGALPLPGQEGGGMVPTAGLMDAWRASAETCRRCRKALTYYRAEQGFGPGTLRHLRSHRNLDVRHAECVDVLAPVRVQARAELEAYWRKETQP